MEGENCPSIWYYLRVYKDPEKSVSTFDTFAQLSDGDMEQGSQLSTCTIFLCDLLLVYDEQVHAVRFKRFNCREFRSVMF